MKATFLDLASIHPDDLDLTPLHALADEWVWRDNTAPDEVTAAIAGFDVVVTNKVVLDVAAFASADALRLVCAAATGVNNIDLKAAAGAGVTVCNARAYATPAVVQHVFAMLLSLTTQLERYRKDVMQGQWSQSEFFCLLDHPIRELSGLSMGIVGYGELGKAVAEMARAFGMSVLIAKRDDDDDRPGRVALEEVLREADVLSLHCPLTPQTRGMIGAEQLAMMKPDAIIINTARGGLVDEHALHEALKQGGIGGAALDVLEQEPPQRDHVLLQQEQANLIITPHTAWASRQARQRVVEEIAANISAFTAGRPRNVVTA